MVPISITSSSLGTHLENLVSTRAAAYAAIEWSSFTTNRINVGGNQVWRQYLTWCQDRIASFLSRLAQLSSKSAVHARSLYTPAQPKPSQTTNWGP
jgi:hypothetical protein